MPDTSDKLVEIAAWAGHALGSGAASLGNLSTEDAALRLPETLLSDPLVEQARQQARLHAQALGQAATALETAAQAGDKAATVAKLVATIDRLRSLVEAVDALVQAIRGRINTYVPDDGTARQAAEAFADTLARGIVDRPSTNWVGSAAPSSGATPKARHWTNWRNGNWCCKPPSRPGKPTWPSS